MTRTQITFWLVLRGFGIAGAFFISLLIGLLMGLFAG